MDGMSLSFLYGTPYTWEPVDDGLINGVSTIHVEHSEFLVPCSDLDQPLLFPYLESELVDGKFSLSQIKRC